MVNLFPISSDDWFQVPWLQLSETKRCSLPSSFFLRVKHITFDETKAPLKKMVDDRHIHHLVRASIAAQLPLGFASLLLCLSIKNKSVCLKNYKTNHKLNNCDWNKTFQLIIHIQRHRKTQLRNVLGHSLKGHIAKSNIALLIWFQLPLGQIFSLRSLFAYLWNTLEALISRFQ